MRSLGTSQWSPSTIKPVVKNLANNIVSNNVYSETQEGSQLSSLNIFTISL